MLASRKMFLRQFLCGATLQWNNFYVRIDKIDTFRIFQFNRIFVVRFTNLDAIWISVMIIYFTI